jgi:hypothetical protein
MNSLQLLTTSLFLVGSMATTVLAEPRLVQSSQPTPHRESPSRTMEIQTPARALGYDIFHIYVAGPQGGEIEISGPTEMPAGVQVCGVRWINPVAWYWAAGDFVEQGPLDILNNGVDVNELWFTGPYNGCGNEPYLFATPATPNGWPPNGAISLVVQVHPDNVEWLDAHGNVIPEPPDDNPDPEDPTACDLAPEFCEIPNDFKTPELPQDDPFSGAPRRPILRR